MQKHICEQCGGSIERAIWKDIALHNNTIININSLVHLDKKNKCYDCTEMCDAFGENTTFYMFDEEVRNIIGGITGLGAHCISCGAELFEDLL